MTEKQLLKLFRANLAAIRKEKDVSQSELARRIGKQASYICDIERARRNGITIKTLAKIATGLGVSPDSLLAER